MAWLRTKVTSLIAEDSSEAVVDSTVSLSEGETVDETRGKTRLTLASGASTVRLDPWDATSGAPVIDIIHHVVIEADGAFSLYMNSGADAPEKFAFSPTATGKKCFVLMKGLNITRSATKGIWVDNDAGAAVNLVFHWGGT